MDTIEQTEAPKVSKRRTKKKPRAKRAAPVKKVVQIPATQEDPAIAGLTHTECPFDCNPEGCVISGKPFCSHPNKGGMPSVMQSDPEAIKRFNRARKILAHQVLDRKP